MSFLVWKDIYDSVWKDIHVFGQINANIKEDTKLGRSINIVFTLNVPPNNLIPASERRGDISQASENFYVNAKAIICP
jgi:hypothetical protein